MDAYDASLYIAFLSVLKPDGEAQYRKIARWYSKTFFTPLHEVFDLPEEEVLVPYYEEVLETMHQDSLPEFNFKLQELLESEEEKTKRQAELYQKKIEEEEFMKFAEKQLKEKTAKATPEPAKVPYAIKQEATLPAPKEIEPDIKLEFLPEGAFDDLE